MVKVTVKDKTYYMDGYLKNNLDQLKSKIIDDWDFCILIDGLERCLDANTLIKTTEGNFKIKDIYNKDSFNVESFDLNKKEKTIGKAKAISTGKQVVYEIETEDGRTVMATKNHTFFIKRGDKIIELKLNELKEGDELICQKK